MVSFIRHTVHKSIFVNSFLVKAKCRASISTREIHDLEVSLDLTSGSVILAHCTCKAGNSGYCNHVMSSWTRPLLLGRIRKVS